MKLKYVYLTLMIIGLILPYTQMIPYSQQHGLDFGPLFVDIFEKNSTAFFGFDLLVAALACLVFMIVEAKKIKLKKVWIPILCTFMIGLAFAFPLFLFMRELKLEKKR